MDARATAPAPSAAAGALLLAAAVGLDAWHAHGLVERLDAAAYDAFARAVGLLYVGGLGLIAASWGPRNALAALARTGILLGTVLFCGDVILGALRGGGWGVAPVGGTLTMVAWLAWGVSVLAARRGSGASS